jgi:hypothetical protein
MGEDKILELMAEFRKCRSEYRLEMIDGMFVGLRVAFDSAIAGKSFSREFYGFLSHQSSQIFSLTSFENTLREIGDLVINDTTCATDFLEPGFESRPDFIKGVRFVYEMAMNAFLKIIDFDWDMKFTMDYLETYRYAMNLVIEGLRDTVLISEKK